VELRRYLTLLRRRLIPILLTVAVAVGWTLFTADRTTTYTANARLYIGADQFSTDVYNPNLSGDQTTGLAQLIRTFAEMIDSDPIAGDALALTGVPRSAGEVVAATTTTPGNGTNLLAISVTDTDPEVAQALATGLAEAFVDNITELEQASAAEGDAPKVPARIFERAKFPTAPSSEPVGPKVLVAALAALAVSIGLVLLVEYLDLSVKSAEEAEHKLELTVLGTIPQLVLDPATTLQRPPTRGRADRAPTSG
jgi:capsular polysaccharide biosynthesis protein